MPVAFPSQLFPCAVVLSAVAVAYIPTRTGRLWPVWSNGYRHTT